MLDDHHVLKAFVLHEERVPGPIDESAHPLSAGSRTPDEMTGAARREDVTIPIGLEASRNLSRLVAVFR
jgi:hypothetical protein